VGGKYNVSQVFRYYILNVVSPYGKGYEIYMITPLDDDN
jgi:hypothetical protein